MKNSTCEHRKVCMKTKNTEILDYAGDAEQNIFLRNMREKLGYGLGWKFREALWEWLYPKILAIVLVIVFVYITSHIKLVWVKP